MQLNISSFALFPRCNTTELHGFEMDDLGKYSVCHWFYHCLSLGCFVIQTGHNNG